MGNKQCLCCEEVKNNKDDFAPIIIKKNDEPPISTPLTPTITKPQLSFAVSYHLTKYKPFQKQRSTNPKLYKFGNDIYQGFVNYRQLPEGYGVMYYQNGNVFIGKFQNGKANGPGQFIFSDGSFYHGNMSDNKAQSMQGQFISQFFKYKGGFKNNMFEGKGQQKGKYHEFIGLYLNNRKLNGTLTWIQNHYGHEQSQNKLNNQDIQNNINKVIYKGQFNQQSQPHGKGKLISQYGEYTGDFFKGKKHGLGQFVFKSGVRYVGEYQNNIREGNGTIYSKSGAVAFCGRVKDGLPHGKGYVMSNFGQKVYLNWIQGLDERMLDKNIESGIQQIKF